MLTVDDSSDDPRLAMLSEKATLSQNINALIAKARAGGPERKAKRMIEGEGFKVPSDAMLTAQFEL